MTFIYEEPFDGDTLTSRAKQAIVEAGVRLPCVIVKQELRWMPEDGRAHKSHEVWKFPNCVYIVGEHAPDWVVPALQQLGNG